uniref:Extensin-like n=1 Tax=Caenorhabditis tropicalis TaxID=1561998 RepID=A0A1I7U057_9PELO
MDSESLLLSRKRSTPYFLEDKLCLNNNEPTEVESAILAKKMKLSAFRNSLPLGLDDSHTVSAFSIYMASKDPPVTPVPISNSQPGNLNCWTPQSQSTPMTVSELCPVAPKLIKPVPVLPQSGPVQSSPTVQWPLRPIPVKIVPIISPSSTPKPVPVSPVKSSIPSFWPAQHTSSANEKQHNQLLDLLYGSSTPSYSSIRSTVTPQGKRF